MLPKLGLDYLLLLTFLALTGRCKSRDTEKYLMLAEDEVERSSEANWLLIPATILAWSAIESFVNNMLDDFSTLPEGIFELHERAFLLDEEDKVRE